MKRTIVDVSQMELNDRVVVIKRASEIAKNGHAMGLPAPVVVGDDNGHVGADLGKAGEVPEAIREGREATAKNLVEIPVDEDKSIPHDFIDKFGNAAVLLERTPKGTGVIVGSLVRSVLEIAGIKNIHTRPLESNSKTSVVLATLVDPTSLRTPEEFVRLCGRSAEEIVG